MYREIWEKYRASLPEFPTLRRPLVGSVIKETRVDKGIRQIDFARSIGLNESTLKSIENDHQQATTAETLTQCAAALGLSVEELILIGRERDAANFFVCKRSAPAPIKGIRRRKRAPSEWHESTRLRFPDFDLTPCSPPIATKKDFFMCRLNLPPKRAIEGLQLGVHHRVVGFVSGGFNIKIVYDGKEAATLTTNQGFSLDGYFPHSIINEHEDHAAVIYLMTRLPNFETVRPSKAAQVERPGTMDIGQGILRLRERRSDRPGKPLSLQYLADISESLDHDQVTKLSRLKQGSSVIYWEKIEDLLTGTGVTMEDFLAWSRNQENGLFSQTTAPSRALIDYGAYHALKIYSAVPPGIGNDYFCGEFQIEGKEALARKSWQRRDSAMIAIYVEEGELEVTVGRRRGPLPILKGESIYFDGSLGYALRNPADTPVRGFLATFPAIPF